MSQIVDSPVEGVRQAFVIAGSDRRGTIYGIYDLSERIGVSPWYWWADVPVHERKTLMLDGGTVKRLEPSVRYRGIFINDEQHLTTWSRSKMEPDKHLGPETYEKVFELLLRLKANMLWPAMHPYTDHFNKHEASARLADEYGIVVGSSHPEPMLRNNVHEWEPWAEAHPNSDGTLPEYDYTVNPDTIAEYWRTRARQNSGFENLWTIGMRGIHDGPFQTRHADTIPEKVEVMNRVLDDQRQILREEVAEGFSRAPQIFVPYKEVLELYNNGVQVPDDVTLVWPDENHGNMRQLPTDEEQQRSGGNGLYYHLSYWGSPQSYLWLESTPLTKAWTELRRAYDNGVNRFWIFNVGDIKPAEAGLEFAMNLAWDVDRWDSTNIEEFLVTWASREFGEDNATEIAEIRSEHYRLGFVRRPEFADEEVFSPIHNGDEAHTRVMRYRDLLGRAEEVARRVGPRYRDAVEQLVVYPVHGAYAMNLKFFCADRNALAVRQGRKAAANRYADLAEQAQSEEDRVTRHYNTEMSGGKWEGIMNPYPSEIPQAPGLPELTRLSVPDEAGLGVASEGNEVGTRHPLLFSNHIRRRRFVDVFNTGSGEFDWSASTDAPWVRLSSDHGTMDVQERVWVGIDWHAVPAGTSRATIEFTGADRTVSVPLEVTNVRGGRGFTEANGYLSIEAEHCDENIPRSGAEWKVVRNLGRLGDSMFATPTDADSITGDVARTAPELRYRVSFTSTGTFTVTVFRIPSLDARGGRRLAVGLDDGSPVVLRGETEVGGDRWSRNVIEGVEKLSTEITVSTAGDHVLKLWMIDPAIAVDQIVVDTGGLPPSYFAPPESHHPDRGGGS